MLILEFSLTFRIYSTRVTIRYRVDIVPYDPKSFLPIY